MVESALVAIVWSSVVCGEVREQGAALEAQVRCGGCRNSCLCESFSVSFCSGSQALACWWDGCESIGCIAAAAPAGLTAALHAHLPMCAHGTCRLVCMVPTTSFVLLCSPCVAKLHACACPLAHARGSLDRELLFPARCCSRDAPSMCVRSCVRCSTLVCDQRF